MGREKRRKIHSPPFKFIGVDHFSYRCHFFDLRHFTPLAGRPLLRTGYIRDCAERRDCASRRRRTHDRGTGSSSGRRNGRSRRGRSPPGGLQSLRVPPLPARRSFPSFQRELPPSRTSGSQFPIAFSLLISRHVTGGVNPPLGESERAARTLRNVEGGYGTGLKFA
ncbi:Hypothetical protein NTJ_06664 [Nesidiocoris tenuis]|uniref:Uncharacterized protein n=1 Tax=Nesidiocoris tenuis TaxID=355587 RepID=A0ABN7ARD9_9HEMI|nr:Hypothetical protein NTJ_06664 [Nesidiocoris tenuis]